MMMKNRSFVRNVLLLLLYLAAFVFHVLVVYAMLRSGLGGGEARGAAPSREVAALLDGEAPDVCVEDLARLPHRECAMNNMALARAHLLHYVHEQKGLYPYGGAAWAAWEEEARTLCEAWECLAYAHVYYDRQEESWACLHKLRELRNLLGPRAYYRGEMPPPVPVWRFEHR